MTYEKLDLTIDEAIRAIQMNRPSSGYYVLCAALDMAVDALREKQTREKLYPKGGTPHRGIIRVPEETGEVVYFPTGKEARESLNIPAGSFGRMLITNSLRDGYRFYYEEDYEG